MASSADEPAAERQPGFSFAFAVVLLAIELLIQIPVAILLFLPVVGVVVSGFNEGQTVESLVQHSREVVESGVFLGSVSLIANALTLALLVIWSRKRRINLVKSLAFRSSRLSIPIALVVTVGLAAIADLLSVGLGRSIVPPQLGNSFQGPLNALVMGLAAVVGAPIVEELVYRGVLYQVVASRLGARMAVGIVTAAFATAHLGTYGFDFAALLQVLALGFLFTWFRARSNSIWPSLASHALANLYATIEAIVLGRGS